MNDGRLIYLDANVLFETTRLRAMAPSGKTKLLDAIHLATAVLSGCQLFVSRDRGISMPAGIRRIEANARSVSEILGALGA